MRLIVIGLLIFAIVSISVLAYLLNDLRRGVERMKICKPNRSQRRGGISPKYANHGNNIKTFHQKGANSRRFGGK